MANIVNNPRNCMNVNKDKNAGGDGSGHQEQNVAAILFRKNLSLVEKAKGVGAAIPGDKSLGSLMFDVGTGYIEHTDSNLRFRALQLLKGLCRLDEEVVMFEPGVDESVYVDNVL